MKASDRLVRCLENEGVEYVFGIIGKEVLDIAHSLSKSKQIKFIPVRHEQAAAFMADIYGRISGKPGICLSTLGPGATNLVTGLASSLLDHSPVIAITGQKKINLQHKSTHQWLDLEKLFEPVSKWSAQVLDANTIPEMIRKAFQTAMSEKPGPVVLSIPENIASGECTSSLLPVCSIPISVPTNEALANAKKDLFECNQPFILVGHGAVRGHAETEVRVLIDQLGCPVATTFMAKGILPKDHPKNYYTFGFQEKDYVLKGIEESDLLVTIGLDFTERLPMEWNQKKIPVLHINALPAEMDEYYPVKTELVGNLCETINQLLKKELVPKKWVPSTNLKQRIETAFSVSSNHHSYSIENVLHVIEKRLDIRTIALSDVGSHKVSIARSLQPQQANQLIISNGLASMGIAIPGAIGAKLASPSKKVICITGDGGALMNIAELETAKRLGLSFVMIVLNDSMLKLEVEMMNQKFGENFGVTFTNPDFLQLAKSFGIEGARATNLQEFEDIMNHALQIENMTLIDVLFQP